MRVIAGKARSLKLTTVPGDGTRPTTDRIKETLFNMLQYGLTDAYFLDLFAGSGAIGIEALSRGAEHAVFVEKHLPAVRCIEKNLSFTGLSGQAEVLRQDVFAALKRFDGNMRFDYIFMDPPYGRGIEKDVLAALSDGKLFLPDTQVIVEASLETDFSYVEDYGYKVIKKKAYQTNCHLFLGRNGA